KANWKLVIENNRECYHCNGSHPELLNTLLEWDDVTDPRASQAFKDQAPSSMTSSAVESDKALHEVWRPAHRRTRGRAAAGRDCPCRGR
ncbi:MAG TPA: SRPBCC family protein, partial [Novosphingobium sp.]|nr:SRPBCC family protein [Novosphingobium sp.]